VRIRPLADRDRDALFGPRLRHGADAWLERQRRDGVGINRWKEQGEYGPETFEEACWRMRKPLVY